MARFFKVLAWAAFFGFVFVAGYYDAMWESSWEGKSQRHFLSNNICPNCLIAQRTKQPVPPEFPEAWRKILNCKVAHYRNLPPSLRQKLEPLILKFIGRVDFKVPDGLELTEEMKVCVAAEACLLILHRGWDCYRHLRSIDICSSEWKPRRENFRTVGSATGQRVWLLWDPSRRSMVHGSDGINIVLHEFAHVIDFASADGRPDGIPQMKDMQARQKWNHFCERAYKHICQERGLGQIPFREYATTSKAEFFACATSLFIEKPHEMKRDWPEIYRHLREYYGLNPSSWGDQ